MALTKLRDVFEPRRQKGAPSRFLLVEGERIGLTDEALTGFDLREWRDLLREWQNTIRKFGALSGHEGVARGVPRALRSKKRAASLFDRLREVDRGYLPS